jgi:uncharacterized SAM-binding protein YcdF (DUF218 family)
MFKVMRIIIMLVILAVVVFFGHHVILDKAGQFIYQKDELKPADIIVILAGEETERVEYGVKLFKEGWSRKDRIIMAGGPVVWKYSWASLMKRHAEDLGVSGNMILLEEKSRTTEEDARFTKEILLHHGYTSIILVTSPYHSKRAFKIFQTVMGDEIKIITAPVESSWFEFDDWWKRRRDRAVVFSEYSKFLWLLVFGVA